MNDKRVVIKHKNIRCPVCGNDDFILVNPPRDYLDWEKLSKIHVNNHLERKNEIYGCTKCNLLLTFNEEAVSQSLYNEEEREKDNQKILELRKSINDLEIEKMKAHSEKEISEIEDKINMHNQVMNNIVEGYDSGEDWEPYSFYEGMFQ